MFFNGSATDFTVELAALKKAPKLIAQNPVFTVELTALKKALALIAQNQSSHFVILLILYLPWRQFKIEILITLLLMINVLIILTC